MTHACQSTQVFQGYAQNDHIGWDVAFGDWDDDGTPDLLAGHASKYDEIVFGQPEPGADPDPVILYMGPFVDEVRTFSPSGSDLRVVGEQLNDTFGHAVTFVGNLELASLYEDPPVPVSPEQAPDDFVVGAPRATQQPPFGTENWPEQGKVYVFLSGLFRDSFGQPLTGLQSASDASVIIEGEAQRDRFGYSIAPAGDFDGDGYPDIAVGAPWGGFGWNPDFAPAQPGKVYILSGKLVEQEALDFAQQGFNPGEQIVSVTDVVLNVNGQDCIWSGLSGGDRFGHDLAFAKALGSPSLGEFDGIVVGAPQKLWKSVVVPPDQIDWALFGPGYGSVITAPPSAPIITVTHTDAEPGFTGGDDVWFGESVAGGVDIDENGFTEILVGAPKWDFLDPANPGNDLADAGKVFVIDPIDPGNWTKRVHESSSPGIWFGWSVGAVGPFVDDPAEGRIDYAAGSRLYGEDAFVPPGGCNPAVIDASTAVGVALLDAQQSAGRGCGTTTVFSASSGAAVLKIEGEDGKDSNGWVIVGIPSLYSGKLTGSFVSSSMRWPNAPGDEYGRIYRFDPIFTP